MKYKFINIGISGVAGCGKNVLGDIIVKLLERLNLPCREFSIAKNLKGEVARASRDLYGIDSLNCSREEKEVIRPFLVAHGLIKRNLSQGRHWVDFLTSELDPDKINIITDIRFDKYKKDEVYWLKNEINGILIHVSRYHEVEGKRVFLAPINETERENDPKVKKQADFILNWKTEKDPTKRIISTQKLLKWVKKLYV